MQKKKIQNMLQVYFREKENKLQSKNIQTVPKYQFKYQSFNMRRVYQNLKLFSNSNKGNII